MLAALVGGPLTAVGLAVKVGRAELQTRLSAARLVGRKLVEVRGEEYALAGFWRSQPAEPRMVVERGAQAALFA